MAKKFLFRGKPIEELQKLGLKELSELFTSSARRKINRGFTEDEKKLLEKVRSNDKDIKTHSRSMLVLPEMVGMTIKVHNGKAFQAITIQEEMIGHRLGEFALSRKMTKHSSPGVGATKSTSHVSMK